MPCYAARWLCPAVGGLRHAVLAPISPNLYWGNQKLGVSGGHLMPDDMGHWMGAAVGWCRPTRKTGCFG